MDDVELDDERDSVFDVVLALYTINYSCDENGERFVKISDVRRIIDDLVKAGTKDPEIHDYDMPDLNPSFIIQNDYVDYVALDEEIAFRMEEEEAKEIIARNDDLVRAISIHEYARYIVSECKDFDKDCKALTNNIAGFVYAEPNDVYELGFVDAGGEREENRLFTDGKTTVIEERYGFKKVKVENASFVINTGFEQGELAHADVISHIVDPRYLVFLACEVRDLGRRNYDSFVPSTGKPYVYTKKMN